MSTVSYALPFGSMSRDQLFCLAAWLVNLIETQNPKNLLNAAILERLLACFPKDPADPPFGAVHRRLARGCSPETLRQFLRWLFDQARAAGGLHGAYNTPPWAYARCWSEVEAIMTEVPRRPWTAKPPNPRLHKVTPELAWAALRRLSGPFDQRGSYEQLKDDALALLAVIGRWERLDTSRNWEVECPACSKPMPLLRDPEHITRCQCHPAHRRLATAQRAAGLEGPTTLTVDTRPPFFTDEYKAEKAVDALTLRMPDAGLPDLSDLESVLIEWERSRPGYAFVCPDCKESMAIKDAPRHMMECARHPAALLAAEIEKELQSQSPVAAKALLAMTAERDAFHSMLSRLSDATETFADNLHWSREGLYSKSFSGRTWWAVQEKAEELLGYPKLGTPQPPIERSWTIRGDDLRYFLRRILGQVPRPSEPAQLDLFKPPGDPNRWLEEEVEELRKMIDGWTLLRRHFAAFGKGPTATYECAACHRPGIAPEDLVSHLRYCRLLPANARARAAVAELWALGKAESPTAHFYGLPIEDLDPTERRRGEQFRDFGLFLEKRSAEGLQTIDRLARGEPPRPEDARTLGSILDEWNALYGGIRCPGCLEECHIINVGEHMLTCERLDAAEYAHSAEEYLRAARGPSPLGIARVRKESDVYALGLARLVDANRAYGNAMRDLDGGRTMQDERQVPNWEAARKAAQALLQRNEGTADFEIRRARHGTKQ